MAQGADVQAINVAFYVMAEMLQREGVLDQAQLAEALDRVELPGKPFVVSNLQAIAAMLRSRPFGPMQLTVVEGGKSSATE